MKIWQKLRQKCQKSSEKPQNSRKNLKTQSIKLKTQAKNSMVRQFHLVELPKTGPNQKPAVGTQHRDSGLYSSDSSDCIEVTF